MNFPESVLVFGPPTPFGRKVRRPNRAGASVIGRLARLDSTGDEAGNPSQPISANTSDALARSLAA